MFQLWDLVLKAYYQGNLKGGTSNDTQDNVLELGQLLYCLVGLDGSGLALGDALGDGDVTQVVFPSTQNTDVVHGDGDGGLRVPPGAINGPVTVTISLITDPFDPFKGPLNTKLDQYGPFFLFEVVPLDALVQPVDIAQCFDNAPPASTHIAHNVGTGIEILGREDPVPRLQRHGDESAERECALRARRDVEGDARDRPQRRAGDHARRRERGRRGRRRQDVELQPVWRRGHGGRDRHGDAEQCVPVRAGRHGGREPAEGARAHDRREDAARRRERHVHGDIRRRHAHRLERGDGYHRDREREQLDDQRRRRTR